MSTCHDDIQFRINSDASDQAALDPGKTEVKGKVK